MHAHIPPYQAHFTIFSWTKHNRFRQTAFQTNFLAWMLLFLIHISLKYYPCVQSDNKLALFCLKACHWRTCSLKRVCLIINANNVQCMEYTNYRGQYKPVMPWFLVPLGHQQPCYRRIHKTMITRSSHHRVNFICCVQSMSRKHTNMK